MPYTVESRTSGYHHSCSTCRRRAPSRRRSHKLKTAEPAIVPRPCSPGATKIVMIAVNSSGADEPAAMNVAPARRRRARARSRSARATRKSTRRTRSRGRGTCTARARRARPPRGSRRTPSCTTSPSTSVRSEKDSPVGCSTSRRAGEDDDAAAARRHAGAEEQRGGCEEARRRRHREASIVVAEGSIARAGLLGFRRKLGVGDARRAGDSMGWFLHGRHHHRADVLCARARRCLLRWAGTLWLDGPIEVADGRGRARIPAAAAENLAAARRDVRMPGMELNSNGP